MEFSYCLDFLRTIDFFFFSDKLISNVLTNRVKLSFPPKKRIRTSTYFLVK